MPPLVTIIASIISLVSTGLTAATDLYPKVKELINMLFSGGIITVEQQRVLMEWANAHEAAVLAGEVPPELTVEPDPE